VQNTQAFWTTIFGYLINQEQFLKIELIGIFACFCGVLMMANPPSEDASNEFGNSGQDFDSIWYILGLLFIVFTAGTDGLSAVFAR